MGNIFSDSLSSSFPELIGSKATNPQKRAFMGIVGGIVADCATYPLHLIYDQIAIEKALGTPESLFSGPEFLNPALGDYPYESVGYCSPYCSLTIVLMNSIAKYGYFECHYFCEDAYRFLSNYKGRLNRVFRRFCDQRQQGKPWSECSNSDDNQGIGFIFIPVIVARYAGSSEILSIVKEVVSVFNTNEQSIAACQLMCRILEYVVVGKSIENAIEMVWGCKNLGASEKEFLNQFRQIIDGQSGPLLHSHSSDFTSSVPTVRGCKSEQEGVTNCSPIRRRSSSTPPFSLLAEQYGLDGKVPSCVLVSLFGVSNFHSYESAIRSNMIAGGENLLRSWFIGSIFAAMGGESSIPQEWRDRVHHYSRYASLAHDISNLNSYWDHAKEKKCN